MDPMLVEVSEYIHAERDRLLKEIFQLTADPLLSNQDKTPVGLSEFLEKNNIEKSQQVSLQSLVNVEDNHEYVKLLSKRIGDKLYHPKTGAESGSKKRKFPDGHDYRQKISKLNASSRSYYASNRKTSNKNSSVPSLKNQKEVMEERLVEFLNKDIQDLEVLTVPEHYPTQPHNVSSLAELYYLTQTLPLIKLLPGSHKTLMTENFESALLEGKIAVLYSRIEELKRLGKWSLRQPMKFSDPFTDDKNSKQVHWDNLIEEGKWMAVDFKETSKYKRACCFAIAQAVNDFWAYGRVMCIKRKPIRHLGDEPLVDIKDENSNENETDEQANPDDENAKGPAEELDKVDVITEVQDEEQKDEIIDSNAEPEINLNIEDRKSEIIDEMNIESEKVEKVQGTEEEPSSIDMKLLMLRPKPEDEIIPLVLPEYSIEEIEKIMNRKQAGPFKLHVDVDEMKKIDQSIVRNLPRFTAFGSDKGLHPPIKPKDSPMIAVSRLLNPFEEDDEWYKVILKEADEPRSKKNGVPEYQKGLFGFQSHRRFNYLKPPKPPLIKNIEYRSPTIWLPQDDKYLIHYVAEFCFNWELISEHLSNSASTLKRYESNIERRTPWQCFERYIQLNEKFQFSDMKGVYSYHAQQWLEQAHRAQSTTKRRISPLGVGNESIQRGHRRLRWASIFDAMRKNMKKREIAAAKIPPKSNTANGSNKQPSSTNSDASSINDVADLNVFNASIQAKRTTDRVPTPAELSKLKFERDKSIQEAYLNQQATRSRMMAAVVQQQQSQQSQSQTSSQSSQPVPQSSNQLPQHQNMAVSRSQSSLSSNPSTSSSVTPQQRATATSIPASKQIGVANGISSNPQVLQQQGLQGSSNAMTKRPTTPNGTPYTNEQIQQLLQIQKQRRLMQQQNQSGKGVVAPNVNNPGLMMNSNVNKQVNGAQVSNGLPVQPMPMQANSQSKPSSNQVPAQSGMAGNAPKSKIHFAPAQVSAIINSIQTKNPGLSKEQVTKLAATYLANIQQQQQNRLNQQQAQSGSQLNPQGRVQAQQAVQHKQPQIATLTPQERNQLQMLKAAKTAQQQQLQQQQLQQQQLQQLQQRKTNSSMMGVAAPIDANNLSKLEYEQRKKMLIQKHQQQQQQQHQQQRLATTNTSMGNVLPDQGSPSKSSQTPPVSSSGVNSSNITSQNSKK